MQRSVEIVRTESPGQRTFGQSPRLPRLLTGHQRSDLANLTGFDAVHIYPSKRAFERLTRYTIVTPFYSTVFLRVHVFSVGEAGHT